MDPQVLISSWLSLGYLDGYSPLIEYLDYFHDYSILILLMITISLGVVMVDLISTTFSDSSFIDNQSVELLWTILPGVVLVCIAFPSLRLLYLMDETILPGITINVMGSQWYWVYHYSNFEGVEIESYMVPSSSLDFGDYRLLDVDNRGVIPCMGVVRLLVSSSDVLHSWTIPTLGVNVDAVPGRLNQLNLYTTGSGILYGQCSEVCGANHSFMPIVFEMVPTSDFNEWVSSL